MIQPLRNLPATVGLALAVSAGAAYADPVSFTGLQVTEGGARWDFETNLQAGTVVFQDARLIATNQPDAVDNFWVLGLSIGAFRPGPNGDRIVDSNGTTLTTAPVTLTGVNVMQQFFMSRTLPVMRVLVTLQNPTDTGVTVVIALIGNLGSDAATVVEATSSGDPVVEPTDRWIITSDGAPASDPVVGTVFFGPGTPAVGPRLSGLASEDDLPLVFTARVPAQSTRRIMTFTQLSPDPTAAATGITVFDSNQSLTAAGLLSGLDPTVLSQIVNWSLGFVQPVCADRVGC